MKIKKLKRVKINCFDFEVTWDKSHNGGSFSYYPPELEIGTKGNQTNEIFMVICHEIMEICAVEMNVRLARPDCTTDYLFVYDHRQHETMINMFSGIIDKFIE